MNALQWLFDHPEIFTVAVMLSAALLVLMILFAPFVAACIPEDYFWDPKHRTLHTRHPLLRLLRGIVKNVIGLILLVLGIIMLFTPGQGLLTIFAALIALDYPGKYRFERWLFSKDRVRRGLNWLRAKAKAPPLEFRK